MTTLPAPATSLAPTAAPRADHPVDQHRWPGLVPPPATLRTSVSRRAAALVLRRLVGRLGIRAQLSDGRLLPGSATTPVAPVMVLHRPESFLARIGRHGLIGFGESYMAGDWDAPDLTTLLTRFAEHVDAVVPAPLQRLRGLYDARHPEQDADDEQHSRQNISRHYDLSNELFAAFLDETMTYSSAVFPGLGLGSSPCWDDLAPAQRHKTDRLLDAAGVGPGTRLLEIGTGWGDLAVCAARRGARVRSVTLSSEQQQYARGRVAAAGLAGRVQVDLMDYRTVHGSYDAIVSVEMVEAVGPAYWDTYFERLDALLAPGGWVALQAITMPHARMMATRHSYTWMHKYVFPGGCIPSVRAIEEHAGRAGLRVADRSRLGEHYAQTLRLWDQRFLAATEEVRRLGFDDVFRRMWHFYLCYSRAGFAAGYLDVQQLLLGRPGEGQR
ncbi:MAG: class I SAM-dependent methyltransferase [Marmoricola sp.]